METSHFYSTAPIPQLYRWFAAEAASTSPTWERLCSWIADAPAVTALLDTLPGMKRQPNLFLGALRYYDGPTTPGPAFVEWVTDHWDVLAATIASRRTQTNEPGRCATLLPFLAALPGPLALIEVGSSAGLCLYPDYYSYRYQCDDGEYQLGVGPELRCRLRGVAAPTTLPTVVARFGIDLNPLDPADPDDARWLRSLVWPDNPDREQRLAQCLDVVAAAPPAMIVTGDLCDELPDVLARVPVGAMPVVYHSAVLAYLDRQRRAAFGALTADPQITWMSNEGSRVLAPIADQLSDDVDATGAFILSINGHPVARTAPHGQWLEALTPRSASA